MPYSIKTKDGIVINDIPDNVHQDDPALKARVAEIRASQPPAGYQMSDTGDLVKTPPVKSEYTLPEKLIGTGEQMLSAATAIPASVLGIGGLAVPLPQGYEEQWKKQNPNERFNAAEQRILRGQSALTYSPRTQAGQQYTENLSDLIQGSGIQGLIGMPVAGKVATALPSEARLTQQLQNVPKTKLLNEANKLGFKASPSDIGAGQIPRSLETVSGIYKTQELLSSKNQNVLSDITRDYVGLPKSSPLTADTLESLRESFYSPYEKIKNLPSAQVETTSGGLMKSATTRTGSEILNDLKIAQEDKNAAWKALQNPNLPNRTEMRNEANALTAKVNSLEAELENLAKANKQSNLLDKLKEARTNIAKTWAVQNALVTDNVVNPKSLLKQIDKGVPISGDLKTAAKFAEAYPNVNKVISKTPNEFTLPDVAATAYGAGAGNPIIAALGPLRAAARHTVALSPVQRRMISGIGNQGLIPTTVNAINTKAQYIPYAGLLGTPYKEQ